MRVHSVKPPLHQRCAGSSPGRGFLARVPHVFEGGVGERHEAFERAVVHAHEDGGARVLEEVVRGAARRRAGEGGELARSALACALHRRSPRRRCRAAPTHAGVAGPQSQLFELVERRSQRDGVPEVPVAVVCRRTGTCPRRTRRVRAAAHGARVR